MKHCKKPDGKISAGRRVLNILLSLLLVFLILLLIAMGYTLNMLGKMNYIVGDEPTISPEELDRYLGENKDTRPSGVEDEQIVLDAVPGEQIYSENVVNILLIGEDARPGESRGRSDTMILCSLNPSEKKLTVTSFMRDMYVSIPGHIPHKLNAAFAWGGMDLLEETIGFHFGIAIHGCFVVNFEAFQWIVDEMDGVEIVLSSQEAQYLGCQEGVNRLNGQTALTYARIRSIGDGDFDRTERQRKVIQAMVGQCKNMTAGKLHTLLETVLPKIRTNLDKTQILQYGLEILPLLANGVETEKICIPAAGTYRYAWVNGMSVLLPDLEANRQILRQALSDIQ